MGMGHSGAATVHTERNENPDHRQFPQKMAGNKWQEGGGFGEEEWEGSDHERPVDGCP